MLRITAHCNLSMVPLINSSWLSKSSGEAIGEPMTERSEWFFKLAVSNSTSNSLVKCPPVVPGENGDSTNGNRRLEFDISSGVLNLGIIHS